MATLKSRGLSNRTTSWRFETSGVMFGRQEFLVKPTVDTVEGICAPGRSQNPGYSNAMSAGLCEAPLGS
jgi:hypothetical protein